MNPEIVLIPTTVAGDPFFRVCFFLGFGKCNEMVAVEDTGLLVGKSSKRVSVMAKNKGHIYTYPAQRAVFVYEGGRI